MVLGGGPAGAAAALRLARAGRAVTVIEREKEPAHRVCGEFIGGDGLALLARLGVDMARLGAQPIERVRLLRGRAVAEATLPFPAAGVSRLALDAALLEMSEEAGATVLRGRVARRLHGGEVDVSGLGSMRPAALLLATGKRDVRGARRHLRGAPDRKIGLKVHLHLAPAQAASLAGWVELMLFPDAYAGLQLVGRDTANLCIVVAEARHARAGSWEGLLAGLAETCPTLRQRLEGAKGWDKPLAIARTPYGFVHRPSEDDQVLRLGDQMGVIPSFTGDGIAIALHTACLAADAVLSGTSPRRYHAAARRSLRGPIALATLLYRAGHAPPAQAALLAATRAWPGTLPLLARVTRAR